MLTGVVGLAGIAGVVVFLDPAKVGSALEHFQLVFLAPILVLSVFVYVLQGIRWHYLLTDVGTKLRLRDTILINLAGQTITAIVPLGDLTRAAFASTADGTDFGTVAATVTVQELSYMLWLILSALPAILALGYGLAAVIPVAAGIALIVVVLTVSPVFCRFHDLVAHIPFLNKLLPAVDELQQETSTLLHRPDALALSVLDAARVVVAVTTFWLVLEGLEPGRIGWWQAAFVLALATIGGAVSLIPGGVGANEASVAALLIFLGFDSGSAGAAAIIQRGLMTGLSVVLGFAAYALINERLHLGGIFQLFARRPAPIRA
ncbi:MAG TPA: lysylphosphatidylglycerol synthase transmembrane domain-containing protein [Candidatus Saccharimonadales bacterium]|nr:lysylphosphatidylglycerol synthase transmembrane domain-containing protein [Candidatus Saccharimonadales bacterium]